MRAKTTTISLLLAGLLGTVGAMAQTAPSGTAYPSRVTVDPPAPGSEAPAGATLGTPPAPEGGAAAGSYGNPATMDVPVQGGEYSTMTQGRPNASTNNGTPDGSMNEAWSRGRHMVQLGTGEASTMVDGKPNANPDDPLLAMNRSERRLWRERSTMGQRGAAEPSWQGRSPQ